jgi:glucose-1-phosphate adenylyltransferase
MTLRADVVAVLLAGGAGERLYPLTRDRAKPAVSFGGAYRIVDFALSNCINSGLRRIMIATQYKAQSLNRHVRLGWSVVNAELGEFIEILPPQMRLGERWYEGTDDAVYQNLYLIEREATRQVLVLSEDHIYMIDYARMLETHEDSGADVTLGAIEVSIAEGHRFGVLEVDAGDRVVGFQEKPESPSATPGAPESCLASMGIYVFEFELLQRELAADAQAPGSGHDFGRDILPRLVASGCSVQAHRFQDQNRKQARYWRDVGTIDAYYEASMDLIAVDPVFNLYDPEWPIRTYQPQFPPAKFVFDDDDRRGSATDSIVSMGCIVSGATVHRSVLSPGVRVGSYSAIEDSILLRDARVRRHARIRRAIVDRGVTVPTGARIGYDAAEDRRRHTVSPGGVVVVTAGENFDIDPAHAD